MRLRGVCADYLEVNAIGLAFPQLRVKVKNNGEVRAKLVEETSGGRGDRFPYPFVLEPRGTVQYFDQHEQISISGMIFRNPMVLMMLFMGLMSYAMPKMMENMDPEELKKMQEEMKDSPMQRMLNPGAAGGGGSAPPKKKRIQQSE